MKRFLLAPLILGLTAPVQARLIHSKPDLKSPLKNPWLIPAVLLVGAFIAVVALSS